MINLKKIWKILKYIYDPYNYPIKNTLESAKIYNEFGEHNNEKI